MWAWDGSISAYTGLKQLQWYEEDTEVLRNRISSASRCQSVVGAELRSATAILNLLQRCSLLARRHYCDAGEVRKGSDWQAAATS